jgi:hypothetical protein
MVAQTPDDAPTAPPPPPPSPNSHFGKNWDRTFTNPRCPIIERYGDGFAKMAEMQAKHDPNHTFEPDLWTRMVQKKGYVLAPRCQLTRTCYCEEDIHWCGGAAPRGGALRPPAAVGAPGSLSAPTAASGRRPRTEQRPPCAVPAPPRPQRRGLLLPPQPHLPGVPDLPAHGHELSSRGRLTNQGGARVAHGRAHAPPLPAAAGLQDSPRRARRPALGGRRAARATAVQSPLHKSACRGGAGPFACIPPHA